MAYYLPADGVEREVARIEFWPTSNVKLTARIVAKAYGQSVSGNTTKLVTRQEVFREGYSLSGSGYQFECTYCGTNSGAGVWTFESAEIVNGPSAEQTIPHNGDGTKTVNLSAYVYNKYWGISQRYSVDVQLPTIARASTPSISTPSVEKELGDPITISISKQHNDFRHTINIKNGNTVVQQLGNKDINDSTTWTPSIATYAPLILDGDTKTFTIECVTFNGSTQIGTKTCSVILKVPDSEKPSFTIGVSEGNDIIPSSWGRYVQGISQLNVTLNETLSNNAPITSRNIEANGATYTSNTFKTNALINSGNITISGIIKDSRTHESLVTTQTVQVVQYNAPQIDTATIHRCKNIGTAQNPQWVDDPDGNYMQYSFVSSISPVANKNTKSFKIQYQQKMAEGQEPDTWHDYYSYTGGYEVNQEEQVNANIQLSSSNTYYIRFIVQDQFNTTEVTKVLDTAFDLINYNVSGRSLAFGKMSEAQPTDKLFECALDADFQTTLKYKGTLIDTLIASAELPVGTIVPFAGTTIPSGYMACDGSAISRTTYAELYTAIGDTYGSGNGTTTFNLPNLNGRFILGLNNSHALASTGGAETVTLTKEQMPSHNHTASLNNDGSHTHLFWFGGANGGDGGQIACGNGRWGQDKGGNISSGGHNHGGITVGNTGGGQAHENMPPFLTIYYIIKVARGVATVPSSVTITNADVAQINTNKTDITSLKSRTSVVEKNRSYSTSETDTGKTWINGKKIYRKVVEIGSVSANGSTSKATGITGLETVISITGMCKYSAGNWITIPRGHGNAAYGNNAYMNSTGTTVTVECGSAAALTNATVIIEYTKSN